MVRLSILFIVFTITGCATNWYHPTANEAQFYQDKMACQQYAEHRNPRHVVPVRQVAQNSPSYTTQCVQTGNYIDCQSNPNNLATNNAVNLANQNMEQAGSDFGRALGIAAIFDDCMRSKGYSKQ